MTERPRFADSGRLTARVAHAVNANAPVTFLFGGALTASGPQLADRGVPNAVTLVDQILAIFRGKEEFPALESALKSSAASARYQDAMQFVIDCQGQDALNGIIQAAVLRARLEPPKSFQDLETVELDTDGWHLQPAVEAVGRLFVENPAAFSAPILTSNFDPLLEVSLRKAGAQPLSIFLPADGQFTNIFSPQSTPVVHLHGYWRGGDTLHTPAQLTRNRPQLKGCLRSLLRDTTLVIMGYGGWTDVFTRTLVDVISEQTEQLNVLWTFFSDSEELIINSNPELLRAFEPLAGQRVVFYKGVDCHVFLPTLRERLRRPQLIHPPVTPLVSDPSIVVDSRIDEPSSGDHPPQTATWVGRAEELRLVLSSSAKVIAITGIAGNGKSTLAAKFMKLKLSAEDITVSYWADCREQGNTLFTQLVRMVERVSQGRIRGAQLQNSTATDVIDILFQALGSSRALLIFDNIDPYVDVEQRLAIGTMAELIGRALVVGHSTQIVLTARPQLHYSDPGFLQVQLEGLSLEDTRVLFEASGVSVDAGIGMQAIAEVYNLTRGHPLVLSLIARQIANKKATLNDQIATLKAGVAEGIENPIIPEIWASLNPKQQTVLRHLAEQVHAEPEERVASYLGESLNYNQFSKAVRALKSLNLVVVKAPGGSVSDALELHPLVRDFIRRRFRDEEQLPYVDAIIGFCNKMIIKFRGKLATAPYAVFENWTAKIELCLRSGRLQEALEVLSDIQQPLRRNGYSEEFLRLALQVLDRYSLRQDDPFTEHHDRIFRGVVNTLAYFGRFSEADIWLDRLETTIPGKTSRYVLLCDLRAYRFWLAQDFAASLEWASRGVQLKSAGNLDTKHDCAHTLALVQRDSGDIDNALRYFLHGENLNGVISTLAIDLSRGGEFYGNIGRCLQLKGNLTGALTCLRKSARILETNVQEDTLVNPGWAALWIGEILEARGDSENAYIAYRSAAMKWKPSSPPLARRADDAANMVREKLPLGAIVPSLDWECEKAFLEWLTKRE